MKIIQFSLVVLSSCCLGFGISQAQTLPVSYAGSSPISFTIDTNGQLFSLGTFDSTGATQNLNSLATGPGTRLLWYPSKAAFRAGSVDGTQWDDAYIAIGSVAFGFDNENGSAYGFMAGEHNSSAPGHNQDTVTIGASNTTYGYSAIALGVLNSAQNDFSTGIGENNTASGYYSAAIGQFSTASGLCSNSLGYSNTAIGSYSMALGGLSVSLGDYSTSLGNGCYAYSAEETVLGSYNQLLGNSHSWVASDPILEVGNGLNQNQRSDALIVYKNGNASVQGVLAAHTGMRTAPGGDLSMGAFTAGTAP